MYRILMVEDDPAIAGEVARQAANWGFEVKQVENFETVMEQFAAFEPHLVLLDITLPRYSGYHWCTRIRAASSVPIVFSPMTIDGFQYVDGGVFMNLPVRPIRDLCEVVIGVHIDPVEPNSHVKNMLQMAERSFHMGILSNMNEDTRLCDVVVMPKHISQYNMFDLSNMDILYEEGYKQALTVFSRPKVKALLGIQ